MMLFPGKGGMWSPRGLILHELVSACQEALSIGAWTSSKLPISHPASSCPARSALCSTGMSDVGECDWPETTDSDRGFGLEGCLLTGWDYLRHGGLSDILCHSIGALLSGLGIDPFSLRWYKCREETAFRQHPWRHRQRGDVEADTALAATRGTESMTYEFPRLVDRWVNLNRNIPQRSVSVTSQQSEQRNVSCTGVRQPPCFVLNSTYKRGSCQLMRSLQDECTADQTRIPPWRTG